MTNRERYIQYALEHEIPFFSKPDWLSIVAKNLDIAYWETSNRLQVFFAFNLEKKGLFTLVRNLPFTPYNQIIFDTQAATEKDLEEMELFFKNFVQQFSFFEVDFPSDLIFANKMQHELLRTNVLELGQESSDYFLNQCSSNTLKHIKKGSKLQITSTSDSAVVFDLLAKTYEKQSKKYPFEKELIIGIMDFIKSNNCGKVWLATSASGQYLATLIQVWDNTTSYYLAGGTDYTIKNSGAMAALQFHAISHANARGLKQYDFEGSQIKSIDQFFKSFGAKEKLYFRIKYDNNKIFKVAQTIYKKIKP